MTSHPAPDLLRAVDEGVLPVDLVLEVRSHLESCRICAQLQKDLLHPSLSEPALGHLARLRKMSRPGSHTRPFRARYVASVAAAAAMLAMAVWVQKHRAPSPVQIAKQAMPAYRLPLEPAPLRLPLAIAVNVRGERDATTEQFLKDLGTALEPYRAGQYVDAASRLNALAERYPRSVEAPFYLGVSRLLSGDAAASIQALQKAQKIGGEALNDDIQWYLAIAHERTGAWQQAAPLLKTLCQGDGPYRRQACESAASR